MKRIDQHSSWIFCLVLFSLSACNKSVYVLMGKKSTIDLFQREAVNIGLQENDTLVDIGSGDGKINAFYATLRKGLHQILIDTNKAVLNEENIVKVKMRMSKMVNHPFKFSHQIIHNVPDTIPLPSETYNKILFRKTLHELNGPDKMMAEACRILKDSGEMIIIEANPSKPDEIDPGCKKKHLTATEIEKIAHKGGFVLTSSVREYIKKNNDLHFNVLRFRKNGWSIN